LKKSGAKNFLMPEPGVSSDYALNQKRLFARSRTVFIFQNRGHSFSAMP
jgi:hypothetical protein